MISAKAPTKCVLFTLILESVSDFHNTSRIQSLKCCLCLGCSSLVGEGRHNLTEAWQYSTARESASWENTFICAVIILLLLSVYDLRQPVTCLFMHLIHDFSMRCRIEIKRVDAAKISYMGSIKHFDYI